MKYRTVFTAFALLAGSAGKKRCQEPLFWVNRLLEDLLEGLIVRIVLEDRYPRVCTVENVVNEAALKCSV